RVFCARLIRLARTGCPSAGEAPTIITSPAVSISSTVPESAPIPTVRVSPSEAGA
ncbi:polymorphic epithelial mucin, partial [Listeria ivanovii FSL F6-596]